MALEHTPPFQDAPPATFFFSHFCIVAGEGKPMTQHRSKFYFSSTPREG